MELRLKSSTVSLCWDLPPSTTEQPGLTHCYFYVACVDPPCRGPLIVAVTKTSDKA